MTTSHTLTGDLRDLGLEDPNAQVWLGTNLGPNDALVDLDNNLIALRGRKRIPLTGTAFSIDLIATNSTGTNIDAGSLRYIVYVEYRSAGPRPSRETWNSGYFELTGNLDLSDAVGTAYLDPTFTVNADDIVSGLIETPGSAVETALSAQIAEQGGAQFSRKRPIDPRDFGSLGTADDTAVIQAGLDAAGVGGTVELPPMTMNVLGTLVIPSGCELRGTSMKDSVLATSLDKCTLRTIGGEQQAIKNLKIANAFAGVRATHDIEIVNPYKTVLAHVELALADTATSKGGIRIYKDAGEPDSDRCFMPQLIDAWIRNGVLEIVDVTDGKVSNSYLWGTYTAATGTVQLTRASNWSFVDVDVVPPQGDAAAYAVGELNNLSVIGGLIDGSYDTIMTGHGIKSTNWVRGLSVVGAKFFNLGRSGIKMTDLRRATVTGCVFVQGNKADNAYPDIDITSGVNNVFSANTHGAPVSRTNKGKIYVEDATSSENLFSNCSVEVTPAHYYASPLVTAQASTKVKDNMPAANWPAHPGLVSTASNYSVSKYDVLYGRSVWASGSPTVTLPSAGSVFAGSAVTIKNTGSGTVSLASTSGQTIDGAAPGTLTAGQSVTLASTGAGWITVAAM